jgi:hypothetical protein
MFRTYYAPIDSINEKKIINHIQIKIQPLIENSGNQYNGNTLLYQALFLKKYLYSIFLSPKRL